MINMKRRFLGRLWKAAVFARVAGLFADFAQ
jgi:hypothetical protein